MKEDFKLQALMSQYYIEKSAAGRVAIEDEVRRYLVEKYNEATADRFIEDHIKKKEF